MSPEQARFAYMEWLRDAQPAVYDAVVYDMQSDGMGSTWTKFRDKVRGVVSGAAAILTPVLGPLAPIAGALIAPKDKAPPTQPSKTDLWQSATNPATKPVTKPAPAAVKAIADLTLVTHNLKRADAGLPPEKTLPPQSALKKWLPYIAGAGALGLLSILILRRR